MAEKVPLTAELLEQIMTPEAIAIAIQRMNFEREQEEEEAQASNIKYEISAYAGSFDVDGIVKRFDRQDIYWPHFQRNYVWTRYQASRFIESILIGLPVPGVFLYKEEADNRLFIVDGFQRITTLHAFQKNRFPNSKQKFSLKGLAKGSPFYNKTYGQLDSRDQRTFDDTIIQINFIEQTAPDNDHSAAFNIFERLNSGGTPLGPQEMRNALYGGNFQEHLVHLNDNNLWRKAFGKDNSHKRGTDIEMILRFLALCNWEDNYRQPMKIFLNRFMAKFRHGPQAELDKFENQFSNTLKRIYDALGNRAFRVGRYKTFNAPYFDAFMVAVAGNPDATKAHIVSAYNQLHSDDEFINLSRSGSTNTYNVLRRIELVRDALDNAAA